MPGHDHWLAIQAGGLEIRRPVQPGCDLVEIRGLPWIVGLVNVFRVLTRRVYIRDRLLQSVDPLALRIRIGYARITELVCNVLAVFSLDILALRVSTLVVIAVGHPKTTLQEVWHI